MPARPRWYPTFPALHFDIDQIQHLSIDPHNLDKSRKYRPSSPSQSGSDISASPDEAGQTAPLFHPKLWYLVAIRCKAGQVGTALISKKRAGEAQFPVSNRRRAIALSLVTSSNFNHYKLQEFQLLLSDKITCTAGLGRHASHCDLIGCKVGCVNCFVRVPQLA